ncbi:MAG: DUF4249 domain-containing protein [Ferruginibacter sp.]|nr:DUF4249 domain-containing protein [Bacteroidota bacterium]MBX2918598.1 DUF4249 domain-containing protein [Ferruginibacter sp.]MCB0709613.1 DUF4249 domain-containing protein [Chitinophagaceae bacterium]MCC6289928.1 DUF4249 domain-containing protein [Chitinophagaceae bacterium]
MKRHFLLPLFCLVFFSCEKNIDFNLKTVEPVLVVDAQIENGAAPTVALSSSLDFFSEISPQLLSNSFVHNAEVTMSNGTLTHTLKEYTVPLGNGYFIYYYGIDSSNLATAFVGEFAKQYSLTIKVNGKTYTANTTIPALTKIFDSIWTKLPPPGVDTSKRLLMARAIDPPGLGNYVRYFTKRNSGPFLPGFNSVFNDDVTDGTTYQGIVEPGVDRNSSIPTGDDRLFERGDTISFKLSNIDKATYTFWNTWEFNQQSIGNPFSQPGKVIGNISNGALGAFCGYASLVGTVIAR